MNYDFPEYKEETFLIRDSIPLLIGVNRPEKIISNYDILSSEFANDTLTSKQHYIDLDNDGLIDTITYKKYGRWGRMHWSIDFGNGIKYKATEAVKRIGILSTKTNGVRDIVIDINTTKKFTIYIIIFIFFFFFVFIQCTYYSVHAKKQRTKKRKNPKNQKNTKRLIIKQINYHSVKSKTKQAKMQCAKRFAMASTDRRTS